MAMPLLRHATLKMRHYYAKLWREATLRAIDAATLPRHDMRTLLKDAKHYALFCTLRATLLRRQRMALLWQRCRRVTEPLRQPQPPFAAKYASVV